MSAVEAERIPFLRFEDAVGTVQEQPGGCVNTALVMIECGSEAV